MATILAFAGSNSSTSINFKLVRFTTSQLEGHKTQLLNMTNFPFPMYSEDHEKEHGFSNSLVELKNDIQGADGIIISVNEHNGGLSAYFKNLIDWHISSGTNGLVIMGTTGESSLVSQQEHIATVALAITHANKRIPIIAGCGSAATANAIELVKKLNPLQPDGYLCVTPYYVKPTQTGLIAHFTAVADVCEAPLLLYNVPGRTGQDLTPEVIEPLSKHKNFIGVKECGGNERIDYYEKQGIACWSGNDDESHAGRHQHGSHGVISVTSNVVPTLMRQLMDNENEALNQKLQKLMQWMFCEPNPIPLNTAMIMTQAVQPVFRLPYQALTKEQREQGVALINAVGDDFIGEEARLMNDEDFIYTA